MKFLYIVVQLSLIYSEFSTFQPKFHFINFYSNRSPIQKYPFYMLIETSGSNMEHDEDKLHKFLQKAMDKYIVCDGFVTNEPGKMKVCLKY
jgi:hypothetical protein